MTNRVRLAVILGAGTPLALVLLIVGAWAIDTRTSDGEVLRNVKLAGQSVGGLDRDDLRPVAADLAERYATGALRVETPEGDLEASAEEIGLAFDQDASVEAAMDEGRRGSALAKPFRWLASLVSPREARAVVTVDEVKLRSVVAERDPTGRRDPVEPAVTAEKGRLVAVEGKDGRGLDAGDLAQKIPEEAGDGELPVVIEAEAGSVSPRFDRADAERLLGRARDLTDEPLAVEAGGTEGSVPPEALRSWLTSFPAPEGLELAVDRPKALEGLKEMLPDAGKSAVNAGFQVRGSQVVIVPGQKGTECCADEASDLILGALERPGPPLSLPLRDVEPERSQEDAEELGIVAPVASFTTNHAAGESRVTNIHRIAEIVRGSVIEPGGTFSVNGRVGPRTRAKGFALGGFINKGVLEEAIGGGVSQFATTLFNAAFFGGLDFVEYQSHSLYISRYPYGREATLSFPKPDLILENNTPHGVLIWPTFTDSSITVTLYSTRFVTGEQTGQSKNQAGNCTRVTTQRTRNYVDGRTDRDSVFAVYRPGEGVDC